VKWVAFGGGTVQERAVALSLATPPASMTRPQTLDELPLDVPAVLVSLGVEPDHLSMLRGMGIVEGREVRVLRRAAFGGPLQVVVGEVTFALDRAVAQQLRVEVVAPTTHRSHEDA
jgi:Fe2+ transport system protein FeoA